MTLEQFNSMLPNDLKKSICLNQSQVSKILGVSPSTLSNWRTEGVCLEYLKIGSGKKIE